MTEILHHDTKAQSIIYYFIRRIISVHVTLQEKSQLFSISWTLWKGIWFCSLWQHSFFFFCYYFGIIHACGALCGNVFSMFVIISLEHCWWMVYNFPNSYNIVIYIDKMTLNGNIVSHVPFILYIFTTGQTVPTEDHNSTPCITPDPVCIVRSM